MIITETRGRVGLITLNRPEALNAVNAATMEEVVAAVRDFDANDEIGAIVLTGSEKAFAAGADIKEMSSRGATDMYTSDWFAGWDELTRARTPLIAAVSGYALGGGCELAMMCDFIIASDTAKFGQPEVNLGVTPGMGGSQRLTRAVGKAKAMEMCLTGRMMDAHEAERAGLVARVVDAADLLDSALETAETIAAKSLVATTMIKEQINAVGETSLSQGLLFERRTFHSIFASNDQKEGMAAFVEKREAKFSNS
ncbi:enoyl-CoA hydratase [Corynebacterium sanguinis]|uniref:Probable enoyl-CoA hydratase echA8 n=1 Tax=Corynebacterium sanguinis TaxID=2594913 RepID=A0A6C1TW64_9CORY|nr:MULTISPECIES: enoyl-CoA hydratase [Corynebacterium]MBA4505404.1 enoyl-CoA hydratase [Corynebacterium sanguinis]MCT1411707.1 enoyl-CoA hydratase [Corynebacterium sanguinis]MCT1413644.1 enoyl-CoA hydratase [Corynebacterium sanguinis]MCT1425359.1 enoyl-CoA hydratase [Corynebacterium sanguinis]MCT1444237.1 enoyl-CoA hydratase [Corynebacterium sanguinis]